MELFHLFLRGEIPEALRAGKNENLETLKSRIKSKVKKTLLGTKDFLWEKEIEVSFLGFTFAIK